MEIKIGVGLSLLWLIGAAIQVARGLRARPDGSVNQVAHELRALRVLRPALGVLFYLSFFEWLLPGSRVEWISTPFPSPVRWAGVALCWLGVGLIHWSFESLGETYRGGLGLWPDHRLVTTGPYSRMRHPIYVGFIVMMAGLWASSGSWVLGVSGSTLTLLIPALRVPIEEEQLRARFGAEYAAYAERTGRFVPRIR